MEKAGECKSWRKERLHAGALAQGEVCCDPKQLSCGIFLILGVCVRSVSLLTTLLLFMFLAGMISALLRGLEIHCGCFGSPRETIGAFSLLRDGFFFLVSLIVLLSPVDPYSLQDFLHDRRTRLADSSN